MKILQFVQERLSTDCDMINYLINQANKSQINQQAASVG